MNLGQVLFRWLVKDQLQQVTCREDGCGKIFSSKGNLTVHKKSVHMKMLPHKCTDCEKAFFRLALLEQHRCMHLVTYLIFYFHCSVANSSDGLIFGKRWAKDGRFF